MSSIRSERLRKRLQEQNKILSDENKLMKSELEKVNHEFEKKEQFEKGLVDVSHNQDIQTMFEQIKNENVKMKEEYQKMQEENKKMHKMVLSISERLDEFDSMFKCGCGNSVVKTTDCGSCRYYGF